MPKPRCSLVVAVAASSFAFSQDGGVPADHSSVDASPSGLGVDADLTLSPGQFGASGSRHFAVYGGAGFALEEDDESTDGNLAFAVQYFLIDDVELIGEVGGWYFAQDGDDQAGVNPSFTIRWHYLNRDRWSLYLDAGIGLLFATGEVPDGGSSFNFMPRAGGGATYRLTDSGVRLVAGARWHHVSNARINGDEDNPDRDGVAVYAGLMFPF
mgnify:CR=1 FL=1